MNHYVYLILKTKSCLNIRLELGHLQRGRRYIMNRLQIVVYKAVGMVTDIIRWDQQRWRIVRHQAISIENYIVMQKKRAIGSAFLPGMRSAWLLVLS